MKALKPIIGIAIAIAVSLFMSRGDGAVKFNNSIIAEQNKVIKKVEAFTTGLTGNVDSQKIEQLFSDLQKQTKDSLSTIMTMKTYKGGEDLKEKAMTLFSVYTELTENEFRELATIVQDDNFAASQDRISGILSTMSQKEDSAVDALLVSQRAFAEKNGFQLK